jgi:alpha-1,6-mannosyltransferase
LKTSNVLAAAILTLSILLVAFGTERTASTLLLSSFSMAFLAYAFLNFKNENAGHHLNMLIGIGIGIRLVLVFVEPNLSDDFYRFIWDGRLVNHGIHPFLELPSYYVENNLHSDFLTADLFNNLNSQNYYTVYPPVLQAVFGVATFLFPTSIFGSVVVMKSFLFLFDIGSIFLILRLLKHFKMPVQNVLLYALNPVVMVEIVGNIHFEGAMIFFSLLAVWLLVRGKWHWSGLSMSVAIVAKLLPLMFLPFLIQRLKWQSIRYYIVVGIGLVMLFLPLLSTAFIENISKSIGLYFKNFEYNGSIYYLLRWVGYQRVGYNWINSISPYLSISVFLILMTAAWKVKERTFHYFPQNMLFALTVFYLLSTTIHPWYITSMVAFGTLTRFRYPMLWSGLIFFTYINYGYEPFRENLAVVAVEYLFLFSMIGYELYLKRWDLQIAKKNIHKAS